MIVETNINILEDKPYLKDILGQEFGNIKVLEFDYDRTNGRHYYYKCLCKKCGNIVSKERQWILSGLNLQCIDCYKKEQTEIVARKIIGQRFGKLKVIELDHIETKIIYNKARKNPITASVFYYKCECKCGNTCVVDKKNLYGNNTQSCGCLYKETRGKSAITHGMSKSRFYSEWNKIIQRCTNPNDPSYKSYGARGIKVCDRWRESFENFRDDMYESYLKHIEEYGERNTTIERIDVNGNYEPSNCTWKTRAEQNRNMTTNIRLIYNGNEYIAAELQRMFCPFLVSSSAIAYRIHSAGYKSGDTIDPNTCYDDIFKGTYIVRPIESNNHIIKPIEFGNNIINPIELI